MSYYNIFQRPDERWTWELILGEGNRPIAQEHPSRSWLTREACEEGLRLVREEAQTTQIQHLGGPIISGDTK